MSKIRLVRENSKNPTPFSLIQKQNKANKTKTWSRENNINPSFWRRFWIYLNFLTTAKKMLHCDTNMQAHLSSVW